MIQYFVEYYFAKIYILHFLGYNRNCSPDYSVPSTHKEHGDGQVSGNREEYPQPLEEKEAPPTNSVSFISNLVVTL